MDWEPIVNEAATEVMQVLGASLKEADYEEAILHEFRLRDIPYERQRNIEITYKGYSVGLRRPDIILNPYWANRGGDEFLVEAKAVGGGISKGYLNQAQVYLNSMQMDAGMVLNFNTKTGMPEIALAQRSGQYQVTRPAPIAPQDVTVEVALKEAAQKTLAYFGAEFFYYNKGVDFYNKAICVELRLRGFDIHARSYAVTYKHQHITDFVYDYVFPTGEVVKVFSYTQRKLDLIWAGEESVLLENNARFGITTGYLIALPEEEGEAVIVRKVGG